MKFEYDVTKMKIKGMFVGGAVDEKKLLSTLDLYGNDGWELVNIFAVAESGGATNEIVAVLKRIKETK